MGSPITMLGTQKLRRHLAFAVALTLCAGCPAPRPAQESRKQRAEREANLGRVLSEKISPGFSIQRDADVESYLRSISDRILTRNPNLVGEASYVYVIRQVGGKWRNFALPGNRIYVSEPWLKYLDNEAELAAVIAIQFAHLMHEDLVAKMQGIETPRTRAQVEAAAKGKRPKTVVEEEDEDGNPRPEGVELVKIDEVQVPKELDFFSAKGVFAFSKEVHREALKEATLLLYNAGYDLRGLIGYFKVIDRHPEASPYDPKDSESYLLIAKKEVSEYPPLVNPTLKTQRFVQALQKRRAGTNR